jgi:hypothetical protein
VSAKVPGKLNEFRETRQEKSIRMVYKWVEDVFARMANQDVTDAHYWTASDAICNPNWSPAAARENNEPRRTR